MDVNDRLRIAFGKLTNPQLATLVYIRAKCGITTWGTKGSVVVQNLHRKGLLARHEETNTYYPINSYHYTLSPVGHIIHNEKYLEGLQILEKYRGWET